MCKPFVSRMSWRSWDTGLIPSGGVGYGGGNISMAELLGERLTPDSIQERRKALRQRLQSLRDPIRRRRERMVPGPDLVGQTENTVVGLRRRLVRRDLPSDLLSRVRGSDGENGSNGSSGSNSGSDEEPDVDDMV